jgi:Bifunctional DNA primase/polymerase, N-terminal
MPTGQRVVVLDIDVKDPASNGFDSLEDLCHAILPSTPMVHTASGGLHVHFAAGARELRCSAGLLGPGLDVRGDGGYVIIPSPGSGYRWDPQWNFKTVALAPAPIWLWPVRPPRPMAPPPPGPRVGLSPYGEAAIEDACDTIVGALAGEQERTLNAECYSIGTLAGAGLVPASLALRTLLRAANAMPDHDPRWPWRPEEIDLKVRRAFNAGMAHPREVRRAVA